MIDAICMPENEINSASTTTNTKKTTNDSVSLEKTTINTMSMSENEPAWRGKLNFGIVNKPFEPKPWWKRPEMQTVLRVLIILDALAMLIYLIVVHQLDSGDDIVTFGESDSASGSDGSDDQSADTSVGYVEQALALNLALLVTAAYLSAEEDAPNGWSAWMRQGAPDLRSVRGRVVQRFAVVEADLRAARQNDLAVSRSGAPEIAKRADDLLLFLAKQCLLDKTEYDFQGVWGLTAKSFSKNAVKMQNDIKELMHLSAVLQELTMPICAENWEDILCTWLAVEQLRAEMIGDKAQRVLEMIFADDGVTAALGMAEQLREIRSMDPDSKLGRTPGGALPLGLIKKLKTGLGNHIKMHFYMYYQAIGREVTNITRIQERSGQVLDVVNSAIMAVFVGIANLVTMRLLGRNVDSLPGSDEGFL